MKTEKELASDLAEALRDHLNSLDKLIKLQEKYEHCLAENIRLLGENLELREEGIENMLKGAGI